MSKSSGKKEQQQQHSESHVYRNPELNQVDFQRLYERWASVVGEETLQEEGITKENMKQTCESICSNFPRGSDCGALLWEPIIDRTPLERRGVSVKWLSHALTQMKKITETHSPVIPTRLFVSLFVEPLVLQPKHRGERKRLDQQASNNNDEDDIPALYFFVPPAFRGEPKVFISHGWESWLRHLFFWPKQSVPGRLAKQHKSRNVFLWLDIFAIVQDPGSIRQKSEVARIGQVVRSIGNTCLVVPGHGSLQFALLPARRSWCCFEIAFTEPTMLSARVGLNKAYFESSKQQKLQESSSSSSSSSPNNEFHLALIRDIQALDCANAETTNNDEKKSIQELLDREMGIENANRIVRNAILQAFMERYDKKELDVLNVRLDPIWSGRIRRGRQVACLYEDAIKRFQQDGII